ncbi:bifunctional phosphoribosyl-AMP cyclohydrolase/phosphoribosyl-ATP diphosphatase HisIE [Candidatus Peregrinibacteria bacterium]|nr:MAG: bifunctional phosphoribosyl-AMP cyclohydrolase/phosphoribosyl-ATP diphosphatase HisIE [Candidatus Peregrinibacteria bacterium]
MNFATNIHFSKYENGLVPVAVQHAVSGKLLMLAFANEEALEKTITTREAYFFSRSRNMLWKKGETSGNTLCIRAVRYDCDADAILYLAIPKGSTCHTGEESCFFEGETGETSAEILFGLERIIAERKASQKSDSYVSELFKKGIRKIAQKVGEEAVETILEAEMGTDEDFLNESADLLFHFLVLLSAKEKSIEDVLEVLRSRKKSEE